MDDLELLQRVARGEEAAFVSLYRLHSRPVYRFAVVILKSEADAEEVVQECFLTLARKAASIRPEQAQLRTWLLGVTRNLCYRRRQSSNEKFALDREGVTIVKPHDIEEALIRNEDAEAVRKAIMSLPKGQREAIVLFELEEMTLAETSKVLGIETNAVKARLHRGRELLRSILSPKQCGRSKR